MARVLAGRGNALGLVHVVSAMESCPTCKPWLDKSDGRTFLRGDAGNWLQFYCNSPSALACSFKHEGIEFVPEDNAFQRIADLPRAQAQADAVSPDRLHRRLTRYALWLCPVADVFAQDDGHLSIHQIEYSTDRMFCSEQIFVPLYDAISHQAVLAADAPRVAGFHASTHGYDDPFHPFFSRSV